VEKLRNTAKAVVQGDSMAPENWKFMQQHWLLWTLKWLHHFIPIL